MRRHASTIVRPLSVVSRSAVQLRFTADGPLFCGRRRRGGLLPASVARRSDLDDCRSILADRKKTSAIKAAKRPTIIETDGRMDSREGAVDVNERKNLETYGTSLSCDWIIGVVKHQLALLAAMTSSCTTGVWNNVSRFRVITVSNGEYYARQLVLRMFYSYRHFYRCRLERVLYKVGKLI